MLKQCCDRLTWYDLNIVSTLPENFFSKCCKNLATAWLDIVLTQSTIDANNAVFAYSRKACYPSLAERITESCKVVLPFEHVDEIPSFCHSNETFLAVLSRGTICFPSRAIIVWPRNENAQTKQKQQTNGNRALWLVYRADTNARGFWLFKRTLGWKKLHGRELSRNQRMLCFDVILQYDWPIKKCLLHIRIFVGGKTKRPCLDLFIHWLIKQRTLTETISLYFTKWDREILRNFD